MTDELPEKIDRMIIENLDEDKLTISDLKSLRSDILDIIAFHDKTLKQKLLAQIPKPSGLNTDFDRGYDKAIEHIISNTKDTL